MPKQKVPSTKDKIKQPVFYSDSDNDSDQQ